jgi:hypothetical protein
MSSLALKVTYGNTLVFRSVLGNGRAAMQRDVKALHCPFTVI